MSVALIETVQEALAPGAFDEIIDVRSPSEFAEDRAPGAVNLPVLDDEERARVGTLYAQVSKFDAKKIGAALIARNVARHLETHLSERRGDYRPLIYCWRGGERSGAMAHILGRIGWRVSALKGGYRAYRRHVSDRLYEAEPWVRVILLDGLTGSGKTEILQRLAARGRPALDLEALAAHRGSVFGADPARPQPSQKLFESRLLSALEAAPRGGPLVVEAESNMIGQRRIPPMLWTAMRAAPALRLEASVAERAAYSARRYSEMAEDPLRLAATLERLVYRHGREQVARWRMMARAGEIGPLVEQLLETHYDPAYRRAAEREGQRATLGVIQVERLDQDGIEAATREVARMTEGG